jgi:hypothetical protein
VSLPEDDLASTSDLKRLERIVNRASDVLERDPRVAQDYTLAALYLVLGVLERLDEQTRAADPQP